MRELANEAVASGAADLVAFGTHSYAAGLSLLEGVPDGAYVWVHGVRLKSVKGNSSFMHAC
jgi:hypothetical protein